MIRVLLAGLTMPATHIPQLRGRRLLLSSLFALAVIAPEGRQMAVGAAFACELTMAAHRLASSRSTRTNVRDWTSGVIVALATVVLVTSLAYLAPVAVAAAWLLTWLGVAARVIQANAVATFEAKAAAGPAELDTHALTMLGDEGLFARMLADHVVEHLPEAVTAVNSTPGAIAGAAASMKRRFASMRDDGHLTDEEMSHAIRAHRDVFRYLATTIVGRQGELELGRTTPTVVAEFLSVAVAVALFGKAEEETPRYAPEYAFSLLVRIAHLAPIDRELHGATVFFKVHDDGYAEIRMRDRDDNRAIRDGEQVAAQTMPVMQVR